jgi:hypothetical protein
LKGQGVFLTPSEHCERNDNTNIFTMSSENNKYFWDKIKFRERLGSIALPNIGAFAKACGISDQILRGYIEKGVTPGLDKFIMIAKTANVSLDWLALDEKMGDVKIQQEGGQDQYVKLLMEYIALLKRENERLEGEVSRLTAGNSGRRDGG